MESLAVAIGSQCESINYNSALYAERTIAQTIDALWRSGFNSHEIVVADDGPTDSTAVIGRIEELLQLEMAE
jgi:hypothetical protein